ncbi:MAG: hypothetical protein RL222_1536 [Bacteroidota bacterium]|jgi:integrase/recombinase XerC
MIEAFLQYLKHEKRYSPKTVESYQRDLLQFFLFIQSQYEQDDLAVVRHPQIRAWVVELVSSGQQPASVKRKISALKSFYKYSLKKGLVSSNPADKITTPKIPERLPKFVEQARLQDLFDVPEKYFEDTFTGLQDRLVMDVLYSCGLRRQELIDLRWEDVNFGVPHIKVTGKGNKQRLVPVAGSLAAALSDFRQQQQRHFQDKKIAPFVFLTKDGHQLYPHYVYKLVNKYISLCSTVKKKSPHVLRHSFATHMSNNGAKLSDIKELLGHASLASTQVYTHNSIEQLKEIYKIAHPKA